MEDRAKVFEIVRAIRRILKHVSEHSRALARDHGLTVPQLLCLKAVAELELIAEPTIVALAEHLQLTPATVSGIVDRLERAGLAERARRSTDRRKVTVLLTPAARAKLAQLPAPLHERFVDRLKDLDSAAAARLLVALQEIGEMMEATDVEASPILSDTPAH